MLPSKSGSLCDAVLWHNSFVRARHHHGSISSVNNSHVVVQVVDQEIKKTETDQLLWHDSEAHDHNQSIEWIFSSGGHTMYDLF